MCTQIWHKFHYPPKKIRAIVLEYSGIGGLRPPIPIIILEIKCSYKKVAEYKDIIIQIIL